MTRDQVGAQAGAHGFAARQSTARHLLLDYEYHAEDCLRSAAETDDPKRWDMLLKLASEWREDAERLRRGEKLPNRASAYRKKA
jgi:hypothetical protein